MKFLEKKISSAVAQNLKETKDVTMKLGKRFSFIENIGNQKLRGKYSNIFLMRKVFNESHRVEKLSENLLSRKTRCFCLKMPLR